MAMSYCLHYNTLGSIGQCAAGCCLHLYFGHVGLCLSPTGLQEWLRSVREQCAYHAPRVADVQCRGLHLPGPTAGGVFLFSLQELYWLLDLLTTATLLRETEAVLRQLPGPHPN